MEDLRVGIAGFGAIGRALAAALLGGVPGLRLAAVATRHAAAPSPPGILGSGVVVTDAENLPALADVVVECAPATAFPAIAEPALRAGRTLLALSAAALLARPDLVELARSAGGRILVPSGALLGLDAVLAAAEGTVRAARLVTRKPPAGLAGAPHLLREGIDLAGLLEPRRVFAGSAREAALAFPANVNVAAALSLAGIGPDRTAVEVWADPGITRNVHRVEVEADAARMTMEIEGVPSANPRTGLMAAQSTLALLRKLRAPLAVGT